MASCCAEINEPRTDLAPLQSVATRLSWSDRWGHFKVRIGFGRKRFKVQPGLYSIGNPDQEAPVFVSANYGLSFDVLRSALDGHDGYILVLDTKGINVWCAAGKGTFGTNELVSMIDGTRLSEVVRHRKLIVPQLGATGVSAAEVKQRSGFAVEFGPIRASDLPAYLEHHEATDYMRRVSFTVRDRLTLIPVELVNQFILTAVFGILFYFIGGWLGAIAIVSAVFAGLVLFPLLLPWLPTHNFSTKGFLLGALVAVPFIVLRIAGDTELWRGLAWAVGHLLSMSALTAFLALNFTGSTTFTSRTGVKREIFTYFPAMVWIFGGGVLLSIALIIYTAVTGA
ncbi:mercury methylation corrinoid protein HgcA [Candidatus Neomarinimicrobiota bacterium]